MILVTFVDSSNDGEGKNEHEEPDDVVLGETSVVSFAEEHDDGNADVGSAKCKQGEK